MKLINIIQNIPNYFYTEIKRIFQYSGRSTRSEYATISLSLLITLEIIEIYNSSIIFIIAWILLLAHISSAIRRLHDIGKSGWFILLPFASLIIFKVKSEKKDNKYGKYRS